jgi:hypothetical protein
MRSECSSKGPPSLLHIQNNLRVYIHHAAPFRSHRSNLRRRRTNAYPIRTCETCQSAKSNTHLPNYLYTSSSLLKELCGHKGTDASHGDCFTGIYPAIHLDDDVESSSSHVVEPTSANFLDCFLDAHCLLLICLESCTSIGASCDGEMYMPILFGQWGCW